MNEPRLKIELVPASSWFTNVRRVLTRKGWDRLRRQVLALNPEQQCAICGCVPKCSQVGRRSLEIHEVWRYEEPEARFMASRGRQVLVRIEALCYWCHAVRHFGLSQLRGIEDRCRLHLQRLNGWTPVQVEEHIAAEGALWQKRSTMEWDLDLSLLKTHYTIRAEEFRRL
jgi:hypothetical protein